MEKREEIKGLREKGIVVWTFGDEVVTSNEDDIILLSLVSPSLSCVFKGEWLKMLQSEERKLQLDIWKNIQNS